MAGLRPLDRAGSDPGTGLYAPDRTVRAYERLASLARTVVESGFPALVDATCLERRQRNALRAVAADCGAGFAILAVEAPVAQLRQRVRQRCAAGGDPSDATVEVLERQLALREPLGDDERAYAVEVDSGAPTDPQRISQALLERAAAPVLPT